MYRSLRHSSALNIHLYTKININIFKSTQSDWLLVDQRLTVQNHNHFIGLFIYIYECVVYTYSLCATEMLLDIAPIFTAFKSMPYESTDFGRHLSNFFVVVTASFRTFHLVYLYFDNFSVFLLFAVAYVLTASHFLILSLFLAYARVVRLSD